MKILSPFMALLFLLVAPAALARDSDEATVTPPAYSSVVLWAVGFEREDQVKIEQGSLKAFTKKGVRAVAMTELAVEDRKYSQQEIKALIEAAGIAAVFEIVDAGTNGMEPHRSGMGETLIRSTTGRNAGIGPNQGGGGGGGPGLMTGMGGHSNKIKPMRWFSVYVTDITSGQQVWVDTVRVTAKEGAKLRVFAGKALRKAAKASLKKDVFGSGS
jgi:hypothetical protein